MAEIANSNLLKIDTGILNKDACIVIVRTEWNAAVIDKLEEGCRRIFEREGVRHVITLTVPGAFEIPLVALTIADSEKFDAVICLGTIIRGQTPHFDYIASEVARGISHAGLTSGLPVVFGIVTADTVDQAIDRAGVKLGNKGFEAAMTAVELVNLYKDAFE